MGWSQTLQRCLWWHLRFILRIPYWHCRWIFIFYLLLVWKYHATRSMCFALNIRQPWQILSYVVREYLPGLSDIQHYIIGRYWLDFAHDDVMTWKRHSYLCPFVMVIHRRAVGGFSSNRANNAKFDVFFIVSLTSRCINSARCGWFDTH